MTPAGTIYRFFGVSGERPSLQGVKLVLKINVLLEVQQGQDVSQWI